MAKFRIAVLVGSLRAASINRKVARSLCAVAADRLDCTFVEIAEVPLFNEEWEHDPPPSVTRFRKAIAAAEGVLFVTPEYNRGLPGVLKNAIDVGSRPYGQSVWAGKPAGVITASPGAIGGFGANHQLRQSCVFLDMPVMQQPEAYLGHVGADSFDADGLLTGPLRDFVSEFATAYAAWVARLRDAGQGEA